MSRMPSSWVRRLAVSDVARVRRHARYVITLARDGAVSVEDAVGDPLLNVVAVVGAGAVNGKEFDEALLQEVGLGRSKPYAAAFVGRVHTTHRRAWARPTAEQYAAYAPELFRLLQRHVDEQVARWKCGPENPFYLPTARQFWFRKGRTLETDTKKRPQLRGLSFAVDARDGPLLRDVLWAERHMNPHLQRYLTGLAKFIDLRLKEYRKTWRRRRPFRTLRGAREVKETVECRSWLAPHHRIDLLQEYLPRGRKNEFFWELCQLLGWTGERTFEAEARDTAAMTAPAARLGEVRPVLRVVRRTEKGALVEMLPSS